jgi:hypothetical protein
MNDQHESPMQEAISYVTIVAVIIGAALFYAGMHDVPVLSWALYHVAVWIYALVPALGGLRYPQVPALAAAATVAFLFWIVGVCCAAKIANWISQGQLATIDRQTARLQKSRAKIQARRRMKDGFDVQ